MISSLEYLVTSEKKLVYEIINRMESSSEIRDEYLNAGFAGLNEAAMRFNMFNRISFREFCIPYIIKNIEAVKERKKQ